MSIAAGVLETPDEREQRLRRSTRKRIRVLAAVTFAVIVARILIKNPAPPPKAVHARSAVQIRPGMLNTIPEAERRRMDPQLVARMRMADETARKPAVEAVAAAPEAYQPAQAPVVLGGESEEVRQQKFAFAKRRARMEQKAEESSASLAANRTMLVRFRSGGAIAAEMARREGRRVEVRLDKTAVADIPGKLVVSISDNAQTWTPPVRRGYVRVKPAKGITIEVSKSTSRRISVRRPVYEES